MCRRAAGMTDRGRPRAAGSSGEMLEERDDARYPGVHGVAGAGGVGHYPDNDQDRHDDAEDPLKHRSRLPTRGRTAPYRVLRRAALEHADGNRSSDRLVLIMPTLDGNIRVRNDIVTFRTPRKSPERRSQCMRRACRVLSRGHENHSRAGPRSPRGCRRHAQGPGAGARPVAGRVPARPADAGGGHAAGRGRDGRYRGARSSQFTMDDLRTSGAMANGDAGP